MTGVMYVNGTAQWLDNAGIIRVSGNTIAQNITIPTGTNAFSVGNITIQNGVSVTVANGALWTLLG